MAMPISNTHLRVPRGFGAILEGLTREILRDQPKDIPKYAARHFEALLKRREEHGIDPNEWAAKLEDRYYNNHSFKTPDHRSKTTVSNINSQDITSEDQLSHTEEDVSLAMTSTTNSDTHLPKSTQERESVTVTHKESDNGPPFANEELAASTEADRSPNEKNTSTGSNHTISFSDSETHDLVLLSEAANIDVCAQETESESEDDDQQLTNQEEDEPIHLKTEDEVLAMSEDCVNAEQDHKSRAESPVSQMETTEYPLQEEEKNYEASEVVASNEALESTIDKSLAEISFEDVPESQQTNNENEESTHVEMVENEKSERPSPQEEELEVERRETTEDEEEANDSNYFNENRETNIDTKDTAHQSTNEVNTLEHENRASEQDESNHRDNYDTFDSKEDANQNGDDLLLEHLKTNDKDSESDLSQLTHSNVKTLEEENSNLDTHAEDLEEEYDEEQQPENSLEKYITTLHELHSEEEEEHVEKVKWDSEVQEGLSSCEQHSLDPDREEKADRMSTGFQEKETCDPELEMDDQEECNRPQEEEDIMDIPLDDPEANRAAAKIQAGFRGHMTRKKMKPEDKTEGEEVSSTGEMLSGSQGDTETGGSGSVGRDDTSVPEQ